MDPIDLRLKASRKNYIFYRLKLVVFILQPPEIVFEQILVVGVSGDLIYMSHNIQKLGQQG